MKRIVFAVPLFCLLAVPVLASPPYTLEGLLVRAKFVCIAEVSTFDGTNVSLKVQSELRGDLGTDSLSFKVVTSLGRPEKGKQYFVFSQGHDHWGDPKREIKMSQGIIGQASYCGWLMLPIQKEKGVEIVKNAFSAKVKKPEDRTSPLSLDQAKELVKQTKFKGDKSSEQENASDKK